MELFRRDLRLALEVITRGARAPLPLELLRSAGEVHAVARAWLLDPRVQGMGIATRSGDSRVRQPLVLKVYMERPDAKVRKRIPDRMRVPGLDDAVELEIEYVGLVRAHATPAYVRHDTPARPGDAIGPAFAEGGTGTFGCVVLPREAPKRPCILSAAHVLAPDGELPGSAVHFPSLKLQGDRAARRLGTLLRAVQPVLGVGNFGNVVDAAIATVDDPASVDAAIHLIGAPRGVSSRSERTLPVRKVGAISGYSTGRVVDLDARVRIHYPNGEAGFSELICCTDVGEEGDSGSLVVNSENEAIGLHIAGGTYKNRPSSFVTPIQRVLGALDVDLVVDAPAAAAPAAAAGAWAALTVLHRAFDDAGGVAWRLTPNGIEVAGRIEYSSGPLVTVPNVWSAFQEPIVRWAEHYGVPIELVIATICTESAGKPNAVREEPDYISDAATPHQVSCGLMQTLISTAREALGMAQIDRAWLLQPEHSIRAGTAYIHRQRQATGFDPPKVACAYNAGSLIRNLGPDNRWRMLQYPVGTGRHADRFVAFFNDCFRHFGSSTAPPAMSFYRSLRP